MNVRVRPATTEDIDCMVKLLAHLCAVEKDFDFDREKLVIGLTMMISALEERIVLVAENGKALVGMVTGQMTISTAEGGLSAIIEDLVVAPGHRRKGIGSMLLKFVESWARGNGATRLQLLWDIDNATSDAFYAKAGWEKTNLLCRRKSLSSGKIKR